MILSKFTKKSDFLHFNEIGLMFRPIPMYETSAIQLHFFCGSFDIYHICLAQSVPFFVPDYMVKISTVGLIDQRFENFDF